jgi:hypothetical protein
MKKIITLIGQAILIIFFGFLTREAWRFYSDEQRVNNIGKDGVRITVHVDKVSNEKKSWRDYISNSKYISFAYHEKPYTLRYSQDSIFLQDGVEAPVIYSASRDEFMQPALALAQQPMYKTSPLVNFTAVKLFSTTNVILFFALLITVVLVVFILGFLATITGLGIIRAFQSGVLLLCALAGAIYLTYSSYTYWQYYTHLKSAGVPQVVKLEDISRDAQVNSRDNSDFLMLYTYQARINFHGESRVIAVGEKDYEKLHPGDNINVIYDPAIDDMVSANYTLLYRDFIFTGVIWLIVFYGVGKSLKRRRKQVSNL